MICCLNEKLVSLLLNSQSLSIDWASVPNAEETHSDTKAETVDNLFRNILSSSVTISPFSKRLRMFLIRILVVVEIMKTFCFFYLNDQMQGVRFEQI